MISFTLTATPQTPFGAAHTNYDDTPTRGGTRWAQPNPTTHAHKNTKSCTRCNLFVPYEGRTRLELATSRLKTWCVYHSTTAPRKDWDSHPERIAPLHA